MAAFELRKQRDQNRKFKKQVSAIQKESYKEDETTASSSDNRTPSKSSPQGKSLKRKRMVCFMKYILFNNLLNL